MSLIHSKGILSFTAVDKTIKINGVQPATSSIRSKHPCINTPPNPHPLMAFMALAPFPQGYVDVPALGPPLPFYPFTMFRIIRMKSCLRRFVLGTLEADHVIRPVAFTKYTLDELGVRYAQPPGSFNPLFFFFYWGPHAEKDNKDMTQKLQNDDTLDRCYWMRSGATKLLGGGNAVRTIYTLYHGTNGATFDCFSLVEYKFQSEFYRSAADLNPAAAITDTRAQKSELS